MNEQDYLALQACEYCQRHPTRLRVTKEKRLVHLCDEHVRTWDVLGNIAAFCEVTSQWGKVRAQQNASIIEGCGERGWTDYVRDILRENPCGFSPDTTRDVWLREYGVPQQLTEKAFTDGWNEAMKTDQEQGRVAFLLNELLRRMYERDEWYGSAFDEPIALLQKALVTMGKSYREEKRQDET